MGGRVSSGLSAPPLFDIYHVSGSTQGLRPTMEDTHISGSLKSHPVFSHSYIFNNNSTYLFSFTSYYCYYYHCCFSNFGFSIIYL